MLFITDFIKNPLHIAVGILSVPTMYLCHEVYPVFLRAKYPFSHQDTINFEILLICFCLLLIFIVLSLNDYRNKTSTALRTLNEKVSKLQKDNDKKDENVKGLIQDRNDLKNERNENRATISNLENRIEIQRAIFNSLTQKIDSKELIAFNKEVPLLTQNLAIGEDDQNDR